MPPRILVAEDNPRNRLLMKDLLTYHGFEVLEAANGAQVVEVAKKHRPDLIIMDVNMPDMDGIAAAAILRSCPETSAIKIVAVTSSAMKGDRERILAEGFDGYIAKPIDTRAFPKAIRAFLE